MSWLVLIKSIKYICIISCAAGDGCVISKSMPGKVDTRAFMAEGELFAHHGRGSLGRYYFST